jgi:hypothetical protein
MTVKDDGKLCFDCKQLHVERKAHRIMPSGTAVCEEHYRRRMGLPQRTPEAVDLVKRWEALKPREEEVPKPKEEGETKMAKSLDQATIDKMRKDYAEGISINAIAEKHGSSWPTVKQAVGSGNKAAKKNASSNSRGSTMFALTPAFADVVWNSLSFEKKAELLSKLG